MSRVVVCALFLLSSRWLVAQEKWTKYLEAGKKESYELKVEDWLAAEKALPELPKSDWRRLFVVNRLLDACDVAEWDSECGGANRRPELLKSAISISKEIHPEGIPFADELVHLSKQFEIPEGLNQALATVSDSLAMVEKLEGPKSVAASKRYLQIANLQRQSKNPKSMLENLRQAVDLQMEYRGPARRDRFELYIDALQEFEEKQEPDFQREVYEKAREEARRLYLRNWKELLAAYRTLISSSQERLRWELIAEYRQVVTKELASGKPESVDALIELAKKIRYTDKPKAREIWTEALRVLRLQDKAVKLAEHNRREGEVFAGLAGLDEIEKKFGIAAENYERAAEAFEGLRDIDKSWLPDAWLDAVTNHLKSGNVNLAEKCFAAGLNDARSNAVAKLAYVAESFGDLYLAKRQPAEAVKKFEIAVAAKESLNQLDTYPNGVLSKLAKGYELAGRMKEASAVQQRILNDQMSATKDALSKDGPQKAFRTALLAWGGTIVVLLGLFLAMQRKVQRRVRELSEGSFGSVKIAPTQMLGLTEESAPAVQEPVFEWNPKVPPTNRFVYHGVGTDLFGMRIYHLLLTILTLGVFSFWGKTRVRKYLCSQAEFLGDRFCFHGTGKELFQGWLKGVPLLGFLFFFPRIAPILWGQAGAISLVETLAGLGFLLLWPIARIGAFRYRMNRMSWRGIRFRFTGNTAHYFWTSAIGYLGMLLTCFLYSSKLAMDQRRYLYSNTSIGNRRLVFTGESRDLWWTWLFALPLTVLTYGLFWFWWSAMRSRYCWAHTTLGRARFRCRVTGFSLAWLWISNALLFVGTLGLGSAWMSLRVVKYWSQRVELVGELDEDDIEQNQIESSALGESFADFIGFDFGF